MSLRIQLASKIDVEVGVGDRVPVTTMRDDELGPEPERQLEEAIG